MLVPIPQFTAPSYTGYDNNPLQKCVNWYHEKTPEGFKLVSLPGYQLKATTANNAACRGAIYAGSTGAYSIHGSAVYRIAGDGTPTALTGALLTSSGQVLLSQGLSQIMIVDGTYGYIIDPVFATVTQITDSNFPPNPSSCACINGQFLVIKGGTDRWYMSGVDDGLTWTPAISGRAITNGDVLIHVEVIRDVVYFIGAVSIELWSAKDTDPYLQPITGATIPIGTFDRPSVAKIDDCLFMLGASQSGRPSVWMIEGGQPANITPPYVEDKISDWTLTSGTTRGFAYNNNGHKFYEVYNTASVSHPAWIFDIGTKTWLETVTARTLQTVINQVGVGVPPFGFDTSNGKIYWLGNNAYPYNQFTSGGTIARVRIFGPIASNSKRVFHSQIRFEMELAFDAAGTTSISPTLDWTDDGGLTYSAAVTMTKTVTSTTTGQRVVFVVNRLGPSTERYYRLTFSGPAGKLILKKCEIDLKEGRF